MNLDNPSEGYSLYWGHFQWESVETNDDDEQNMGQGLRPKPEVVVKDKKKNKSFLNRLFRRKWVCLSLSLKVEFWLDK